MIKLNLVSVGMVEETGSVLLVLRAEDVARLLVMEVGLLEGRAIALEAEGIKAPRPLTHELTLEIIRQLGATISQVQIREFKDSVFFAYLVLDSTGGSKVEIDSRPSDAIALALRSGAPIYVDPQVLSVAGIEPPDDDDNETVEADEVDDEEDGKNPFYH